MKKVKITRLKDADKEAKRLAELFSKAEKEINDKLLRLLAKGKAGGYTSKQLKKQEAEVKAILSELNTTSSASVNKLAQIAYSAGASEAERQLKAAGIEIISAMSGINAKVMQAYASQLQTRQADVITAAGRSTIDLFRAIDIDRALTGTLAGYESINETTRKIIQRVEKGEGIVGFIDNAGRTWSMSAYVDMLTRTATMKLYNEAKKNEFIAHREDLVIVSSHGGGCALCKPFDGKILSLTGATEGYTTLDEAEAEGLFHPNCRHTYDLYIDENNLELGVIEEGEGAEGNNEQDNRQVVSQEDFASKVEETFNKMKESERKFIADSFKDVPKECQDLVLKYRPSGFSFSNTRGQFQPLTNTIRTKKDNLYTTFHEYGHCIDFNIVPNNIRGYYSSQADMREAIAKDSKAFDRKSQSGKDFYDVLLSEAQNRNSGMWKNAAISDIFDAMTKGQIHDGWGHGASYYKKATYLAPTEIFADLFALSCERDKEGLEYVKRFFPETVKVFQDLLSKGGI